MHFPTLIAATVLALAHLTLATPPGCLLGAINTYTNPADVKTVCQAKDLSSTVLQFCGSDAPAAMQALKDICGDAGQEIAATSLPSSTGSAKPSGTASSPSGSGSGSGSAQSTGSANPTATGGAAPSGSGNQAASGSVVAGTPQATGAAGRVEVGVLAGVVGVVVWAL